MTDVDPVAELAAELVALRRQFSTLATNQERTADTANRAVQGLDDLEEQLTVAAQKFSDAAQATPEEDPAPAPPPGPEPLDVVVLYAWVGDHISNWRNAKPSAARATDFTGARGGSNTPKPSHACGRYVERGSRLSPSRAQQ